MDSVTLLDTPKTQWIRTRASSEKANTASRWLMKSKKMHEMFSIFESLM